MVVDKLVRLDRSPNWSVSTDEARPWREGKVENNVQNAYNEMSCDRQKAWGTIPVLNWRKNQEYQF